MPRSSAPLRPAALVLALLVAAPAVAVRAPEPGTVLPDMDVRTSRNARYQAAVALARGVKQADLVAGPAQVAGDVRHAALARLGESAGPLEVRWDEVTGSPRLLFALHGFLSQPDARDADVLAREFLRTHRDLFLMSPADVDGLSMSRAVPTSAGGMVVRFEASVAGTDVLHGHVAVSVAADGRIAHVTGGHVAGSRGLRTAAPQRAPAEALHVLAAMAGVTLQQMPAAIRADAEGATFRVPELRGDVTVRRTIIPVAGGLRWGWTANAFVAGSPAGYELTVDDATLAPVRRATRTWHLDTQGRVFFANPDASPHELARFADPSDYRRDESPIGWTDESLAILVTVGNNTIVQDDIADDDEATPGQRGQVAAGPPPSWLFDHPFTGGGPADAQASLTNLFYGINYCHDRFHALGFDERSGNFQQDNLGRGGLGGDPVLGDDMDGSGTNNANFQTPPDGQSGRMQMFLWDASGSNRSSSFDTGVVIHEYVHGVSTRLVGGPEDVSCLFAQQGGSMGEGWSDYFAASFLEDPVIGSWVVGDPRGIRMFRLDENPPSGKDYRDFCTYPNDQPPQLCEPHDNGEIWSGFLWLLREDYVARYGAADGVAQVDQLIVDAMKLTPCTPSMLDARDAIILADRLATGGVNECAIKAIAARRWMGSNASSTGGTDAEPVAGNAQWPECVNAGVVRFDRDGLEAGAARATYSCADQVTISLTDGNYVPAADSVTLIVYRAAAEVDRETVTPAATAGVGVFTASLASSPLAGLPGDGLLQVQAGDEIEASYADLDPPSATSVRADISCTPRLRVTAHRVVNGSCDADSMPGYPELPGFVDRGETADVVVQLANLMPFAVNGTLTVSTDRPDLVTVLPSLGFPVAFPAAIGTSPATIEVPLTVVGSATISPGDVATLELRLQAQGYDGGAVAATLPLELGMDYELETGLTQFFDMEAETPPVGPDWSSAELNPGVGNQWTVVTCRNTTPAGRKAFRNGPANCAGRYSDAQGNPYLASPALSLFAPTTRAARILSAEWQNDIDLGVTGFPPSIPLALDAEAVAVTVTNDPAAFDTSDVIAVATTSLAFYIKVDIPGFYSQDSNTTGFVLDHRDVVPGQLSGVDFSRPVHLTWYFLPDITFVQPPLDAQGDGYFLDDVLVAYERVNAVPRDEIGNPPCVATTAVVSLPRVTDPAAAAACAGTLVTVDASFSESALCGPPATLEYRFLRAGAPLPCLETDGVTPRVQDVDGWGLSATCSEAPTSDATYDVEVRCAAVPDATDLRSVTVRIVDGLPVVTGSERAFCIPAPAPITLSGADSSLVGCPGVAEYRWSDAAGAPLDCDGDGTPDDFSGASTCQLGHSDFDIDVTLEVRCSTLPACALRATTTIPSVSAFARIIPLTRPPGGFYCSGTTAQLDGSFLGAGCDLSSWQFHWTSNLGYDSGWGPMAVLDVVVTQDEDFYLETRCSLNPSCVSAMAGPESVLVRTGSFAFNVQAEPDDCAGDLFQLRGGVRDPPGVRCAGTVEYRYFHQQPGPTLVRVACFDDATGATPRTEDVDGWGAGAACWTPHVAGGGDFVIQYRCSDDPACVIATSTPRTVTPRSGTPAGSTTGTLRVRKSAPGCPVGGDVRVLWTDSDFNPPTFILYRSDDVPLDAATDRLANVDDVVYTDGGAACDGGGVPYRGATVYFYLHAGRDSCTNEPLP